MHPLDAPLPSAQAVARMSMAERAELSPAEKFDILRGDFADTLTTAVRRESDFSAVSWAGLCHGWAQAALAYPEPSQIVATLSGLNRTNAATLTRVRATASTSMVK